MFGACLFENSSRSDLRKFFSQWLKLFTSCNPLFVSSEQVFEMYTPAFFFEAGLVLFTIILLNGMQLFSGNYMTKVVPGRFLKGIRVPYQHAELFQLFHCLQLGLCNMMFFIIKTKWKVLFHIIISYYCLFCGLTKYIVYG